ncbi:Hypothetical protein NGAL_HAMBI1145_59680 [Neorhizobium galegae bv. officinalis]|uniref:Uncharacterized protein n=1 Tax=Neorhizobium galegae bv. officinalis TaxID=323656 RepID=A0A0T7G2X1_NEOGA|nr:Hypothetical protein NGAL_HAMBI1145_59680 [Neorhizobium galegae bv. officinalis]
MSIDTNADQTAILKQKELTELILRNASWLAFPATEWEAQTLREVLLLPRVIVTRPPEEQLLAAEMVPYDCHANCSRQEANDPERTSRHVCGWIIDSSDLILHSVVEMSGQWLCLTPQLVPGPRHFEFIPDPLIEWRDTDDGSARDAIREGMPLPHALRKYPERHIRMRDELLRLVASGTSVIDARDEVDATLGAELRRMGPI